jgi:hypothetical protein
MLKHSMSSVISYPNIEGHLLTLDIDATSCRPQPPQRRLHSAARPHPLPRAQHRPQPPERGSTAGAAAAAAGAGINGTQELVILGDKN